MSEWDQETGEVYNDEGPSGDGEEVSSSGPMPMPDVDEQGGMVAMLARQAQHLLRDPKRLIERAKQIGGLLGKKGFYRFPAGGKSVEGESVHLAQALAQEWGGILYQTRIVHAAEIAGGSQRVHLRSSVADLRALVCAEIDQVVSTSPPPGKFAKDHDQRARWNAMQVQNASSKVVRNAILDVLPKWYTQPAFDAAKAAAASDALGKNKDGSPRTLEQARQAAADACVERGCTMKELELYTEQPFDMWAVPQIQLLRDLWADLKQGRLAIAAWREGLQDAQQPQIVVPPSRNALGLPARTTNPIDEAALKELAKDKSKKAEQADLPGASK